MQSANTDSACKLRDLMYIHDLKGLAAEKQLTHHAGIIGGNEYCVPVIQKIITDEYMKKRKHYIP